MYCKNCNKELSHRQIVKKNQFCSKACATSFRCKFDDPNFFEIENEHIVYYILGLIITDGNISKEHNKITLSLVDKSLIEKLAPIFISPKRKIYQYQPKNGNASTAYTLINTNKDAIQSLISEYDIKEHKTYDCCVPNISNQFIGDFLRGVFDGDGCIYVSNKTKKNYYAISITSASASFANQIKLMLEQCGLSPTISTDVRRQKTKTYYIKLYKQNDVQNFMSMIYENSNGLYMQYKHDKFYVKI